MAPSAERESGIDAVASVVQRLAVLLAAGVVPASGWGYLAEGVNTGVVAFVAAAAADGRPVSESIVAAMEQGLNADEQAWRGLAAAWQVASEAGASLAPSLRQLASSLRDLSQTRRDVIVALAGPIATAKMVIALPFVGVLFGLALGFDTLGTLFTTVPGWACLVLGVGLIAVARWWNRKLVTRAQPALLTPGLSLDLMAIAVSGGASLGRASAAVDEARERCGLDDDGSVASIEAVLSLSRRAGVPAAALLRSEAEEARRDARSEGQSAAAKLAVTLMLPLGLCILPAFMLLGVVPLLIAIVTSTVSMG
ncbi:MAG: type II secretion system F family protein [Lacisediminihabitans sp.]